MLSTITKRLSAFVLSAVMLLSAVPASAEAADSADAATDTEIRWEEKIDDYIFERMEKADDDDIFYVCIYFVDTVDREAIDNEIFARTGISRESKDEISDEEFQEQLALWSDEQEEELRKTVEPENLESERNSRILSEAEQKKSWTFYLTERDVRLEVYTEYNNNCIRELGLNVLEAEDKGCENMIETGTYYVAVNLTKSDVIKAAMSDLVYFIERVAFTTPDTHETSDPNPLFSDELNKAIQESTDSNVSVNIQIKNDSTEFTAEESKTNDFLGYWVEQLGIEQYKPQTQYSSYQSIYVRLPISELNRITSEFGENIEKIYWWHSDSDMFMDADRLFSYTSGDSLNILRASVGLEEKHWNAFYDVNQDGSIDSSDALTALRASVGLEQVSYNIYWLYPLYDVEEYGLPYSYNGSFSF